MRRNHPRPRRLGKLLPPAAAALALASLVGDAAADDRNLFRGAADAPYIFALFDTSGSMASPATCAFENCDTLGAADAPDSRMYQLKSALYDIARDEGNANVRWGFAKFNQIDPDIRFKAWLYQRKPGQTWSSSSNPPWFDRLAWPPLDDQVWFGNSRDSATVGASCAGAYSSTTANILLYLSDFPKLGYDGTTGFSTWVTPNNDGLDYRFQVQISGMTLPIGADSAYTDEIELTIRVRAVGGDCSTQVFDYTETVTFAPYYAEDDAGIDFRDGSGPLGFDFIAREGTISDASQQVNTVSTGTLQSTRNRWDRVENDTGGFHNYGNVCPDGDEPVQWEPNETSSTGSSDGDTTSVLEIDTSDDPLGRTCTGDPFDRGDVLPWDWIQHPQDESNVAAGFEVASREALLYRLAPNTAVAGEFDVVDEEAGDIGTKVPDDGTWEDGDPIPDFRVARYFEDVPDAGVISLKTEFANYPPLIAGGGTPLTGVLTQLQTWAEAWEPCAHDDVDGDRTYECRQRFAILLTDGIQGGGCDGDPAAAAEALYNATRVDLNGDGDNTDTTDGPGIRTIVVGFGAFLTGGTTSSQLAEIAAGGGTGTGDVDGDGTTDCTQFSPKNDDGTVAFDLCATDGVILAEDKEQLVDVLGAVIGDLVTTPTSFATAAVPQSQTVSEDSIFLASFIPTENSPHYFGRLWHFVRPLPLVFTDGRFVPDTTATCDDSDTDPESCLAWDANSSMLGLDGAFDQVPTFDESATDLQIGAATNQRRIYYSRDPTAGGTVASAADDVGRTMRLLMPTADNAEREDLRLGLGLPTGTSTAVDASMLAIFREVVAEKTTPDPDQDDGQLEYILGDVFHSDPTFLGQPPRTEFLISEPAPARDPCANATADTYGCFFSKHRFRRHVVFAGANDGMLHAFDAGEFTSSQQGGEERGTFDLGTGQELFAFVPRALLPSLATLATGSSHEFRFDGTVRVDDVFIDPVHTGTPTDAQREWRTVLVAGYREGGRGYVALDVTQPDPLQERTLGTGATQRKYYTPVSSSYVPGCIPATYDATDCGPLPYGASLWEISDDQADFATLGDTWSRPTTGRIKVVNADDDIERRYVAIFGGGYDPANPNGRTASSPSLGRHLYMVDIETGQILYQRELDGSSVPSDPAVADTDGDGILDTIYIGTYGGSLFKVDMKVAGTLDGNGQVAADEWEPFEVFCTGTWDDNTELCSNSRPIFFPPSIIFVGSRGRFAIAFGTGDRDDLWNASRASEEARYYVLLDTGWGESGNTTTLPLTEDDYDVIAADAAAQDADRLLDPLENGYVLALTAGEKLFTPSFALSGLLVFNTVTPLEDTELEGGATLCEFSANTNIYTLFTTSGDALSSDADTPRFRTVAGAVSSPFTETTFRNIDSSESGDDGEDSDGGDSDGGDSDGGDDGEDRLTEELLEIRNELMKFYPPNCRFSTATVDVQGVRQDTGIEFIAPVPVCVIQKNWKEL